MARLVDLTHPLADGQPNFPLDPPIRVTPFHTVASIGYNLAEISMSTHQGTHLDAPYHFFDNGKTLDRMALDRFYGPARLIDLGRLEPRSPITVAMLEPHAAAFEAGAKVIYRTGWQRAFGTEAFFSDYPDLTLEAARWIADRRIGLLGMDTPTPSSQWLECHHILLGAGTEIVIVEALANLDQVPAEFLFIGFPLLLAGRDGSPIRAVAVVE